MTEQTASRLRTKDLTLIALFTVLTAVCAWISVPVPAPLIQFTMQTFAVFAALLTLGGKRGTYAVTAYLLLGAVGAPVFSNFRGGLSVLLGATGGYIMGFLAAGLVYWLTTALLGEKLPAAVLACLLGMVTYYILGTAWFLAVYSRTTGPIGLSAALGWCVIPFIVPDLLKMALAVVLSRRLKRFIKN